MTELFKHIISLKQARTIYGPAPHKPVLILAVIELFEEGVITNNWIEISDELFQKFHDIWKMLVKTQHTPNFSLPFFHLKNEKGNFWKLITYPGKDIPTTKSRSIKSFKALESTVLAATLSEELLLALMDSIKRQELKQLILKTYFGFETTNPIKTSNSYTGKIKTEILFDPEHNFARKVRAEIDNQPKELKEEYLFLRSSVFRKTILEIYDGRCAITGIKVIDSKNKFLVDACHIEPFAENYNDSIKNGIALSPTFHRAFDRGLIAISDKYKILVHPSLHDYSKESSIISYKNKDVYLPEDSTFYPSLNRLRYHRKRFGFGF